MPENEEFHWIRSRGRTQLFGEGGLGDARDLTLGLLYTIGENGKLVHPHFRKIQCKIAVLSCSGNQKRGQPRVQSRCPILGKLSSAMMVWVYLGGLLVSDSIPQSGLALTICLAARHFAVNIMQTS